jgi:ubiquinone/menaquinone biosynthesis C-methylase UbiE
MDLPQKEGDGGRYTTVGGDKQILQGSCFDLSGFCNESLDFLVQNHLLEDFSYSDLVKIITEWRRVLKIGGRLVCNNPDQQRFKSYIKKHNQGDNLAHHEQDFSLETFKRNVLDKTGPWEITYEMPDDGKYSWYLVATKI